MTDELSKKIRWHVQGGLNAFEDLDIEDAAENARFELIAIGKLLDQHDEHSRVDHAAVEYATAMLRAEIEAGDTAKFFMRRSHE